MELKVRVQQVPVPLCVSLVRYVWDLPTKFLSMSQGNFIWLVLPHTVPHLWTSEFRLALYPPRH